jgi:hypothetical protein
MTDRSAVHFELAARALEEESGSAHGCVVTADPGKCDEGAEQAEVRAPTAGGLEELSDQLSVVVALFQCGLDDREIADILSERTGTSHRTANHPSGALRRRASDSPASSTREWQPDQYAGGPGARLDLGGRGRPGGVPPWTPHGQRRCPFRKQRLRLRGAR